MTLPTMTRPNRAFLLSSALLIFTAARPLPALAFQPFFGTAYPASTPDDDSSYTAGTHAMNEQRWPDAVSAFDKVINAKGKKTDAALYWKAYSLKKLGNSQLASATCFQLRSQYTGSSWNKDCDALSIDTHVYNGNISDKITQSK